MYEALGGGKKAKDAEDPKAEREMRDRMNGIKRDKDGNVTHRNGKPVGENKEGMWYDAGGKLHLR